MAGRLDVRLLGGVEVDAADGPVRVTGAKLQAIIAMLALGAPHPVSHERLIDELWADEPPSNPANALQAQISALRRVLGRDAVERRGTGYVLSVGPDDVDTIRLERLVRDGRDALTAGDPHGAATHFRAALDLVRGPSLNDLADFGFAREAAARLDDLVVTAHEGLADAQLQLGAHVDAAASLSALVRAHPLRERLHAQLILALYRCGRQADALRAYQEARNTLLEELGLDPGPELQALERAVLAHDPALEGPSATAPPAEAAAPASLPVAPGRLPLVGRDDELAALRADLDSARAGHGRVTLVGGEPGVGKTRLVEELAAQAAALGTTVVWGRCYEGRGAPTFWPWTQIIDGLLAQVDDTTLLTAIGTNAAELAQIVPQVKELVGDFEPPAPIDPEGAQFRLYQAIATFLQRLARTRPLLLVVDDLHWADAPSLELLAFATSTIDDVPMLMVGTFRDVDPSLGGALAATLANFSRHPTMRRAHLKGLDVGGVGELFAAAGTVVLPELLDSVVQRTQGNPFFVTELLHLVPPTGIPAGQTKLSAAAPESVKGVIRQRVARLPEPTIRTITYAATLGQAFDLTVLAASIDVDGATLLDQLEPAIEAGLIVDNVGGGSRYRFSHGLVNETIYDETGHAQRARTHLQIAEALERQHGDTLGPHLFALAAHWFHAVPAAPPDKGIDYAIAAAAWAGAHVAHQQAEEQLRLALELIANMPEGRARATRELTVQDLLCVLLITRTSYSDPEFGRVCARVRELSEQTDDHDLLIPALWRLSIHHFMRSDLAAGLDLGHQLVALPPAGEQRPAEVAGRIALALTMHEQGDQVAARRQFDQAISLCAAGHHAPLERSVTEDPPVFVMIFSAINHWLLGHEDDADRESVDAFYYGARDGSHTWAAMVAVWGSSTVSMLRGDAATTLQRCDDGIGLAIAGGYGLGVPYMGVNRGWATAMLGDVDAGADQILEGAAIADAFGARYMRPAFSAMYADVCLLGGRLDEAAASIADGIRVAEETGERWFEAELHRLRGETLAALGRADDEVGDAIDQAEAIATSQGAVGFARRIERSRSRLGSSR